GIGPGIVHSTSESPVRDAPSLFPVVDTAAAGTVCAAVVAWSPGAGLSLALARAAGLLSRAATIVGLCLGACGVGGRDAGGGADDRAAAAALSGHAPAGHHHDADRFRAGACTVRRARYPCLRTMGVARCGAPFLQRLQSTVGAVAGNRAVAKPDSRSGATRR